MAEYKNIWYADGSEQVSAADSSYNQAVSIGDEIESLKYKTPIICMNTAEMNAAYPTPVQFNRVYRVDIGKELMYFEKYSTTNTFGRANAGWYEVSSGLVSICDGSAYTDGTSTTLSKTGKLSFVGAKNIYLPSVFNYGFFQHYRLVINITNSSAGSTFIGRYMSGGSQLAGSIYLTTNMVSETATAGTPPSAQVLTGTSFNIQGSASYRNFYAETTFFNVASNSRVQCLTRSAAGNFSTSSRVQSSSTLYNSTTDFLEGLKLSGNGTVTFDGSVEVFGYQ